MVQQNCQEETTNSDNPTQRREQTVRSEDFQPTESTDDAEAVSISGRSKMTSSIVITMSLEFNSTCRWKKHSSAPLKYIDVTGSTHTDLDVM